MNKTIVVNLFGVPSAGKSSGAMIVCGVLKTLGVNAELITEYAKDKVWEENTEVFKNQAYIFGKQSFKQSRVRNKVDVIITDSPLLLSVFYNSDPVLDRSFNKTVFNVFNSYENINYLIMRVKEYNPKGRHQTEAESDALKQPMIDLLDAFNLDYIMVDGNFQGYRQIINETLRRLNTKTNTDADWQEHLEAFFN